MGDDEKYPIVVAGVGAFFNILRFAIDIVTVAGRIEEKKESAIDGNKSDTDSLGSKQRTSKLKQNEGDRNRLNDRRGMSTRVFDGRLSVNPGFAFSFLRRRSSIPGNVDVEQNSENEENKRTTLEAVCSMGSFLCHLGFFSYFVAATVKVANGSFAADYEELPLGATTVGMFAGLLMSVKDYRRIRFTNVQRFFYVLSATISMLGSVTVFSKHKSSSTIDVVTLCCLIIYFLLSIIETKVFSYPVDEVDGTSPGKKAHLGKALMIILKPYFWPSRTSTSALMNRTRAIMTWVCVASSKACNLTSPIFLGKSASALARFDYASCAKNAIIFSIIQFSSTFLKEMQSLIYLKVAQAAFVQLSEVSFFHLHSLSLDWHLRKKLGEVIRSMDRGILACDTLMKYLFLWMVPAIVECVLVCIIFGTYFDYLPLSFTIFIFVFVYMVWTILVTLWRKKFRKQVTKSDNDWHDKCTDSLINFETVKYFTAEKYEIERFSESVKSFQSSSVQVQASLTLLNVTQTILMQTCLATALVLSAYGIKKRFDCCISNGCNESNLLECCSENEFSKRCTGMDVGDFVAVLSYTLNLFGPLNFLGSVYNAVVMALVDLRHLSELLAEEPDLRDAPDAIELPQSNKTDPEIAVEFDNVVFNYPTQAANSGLKGVSFKMKRGTTTAIVGTTGAGKTTISRLLFRFYDVLGGAVKVNGVDVRAVTQASLRQQIGVVPQAASLFNDTLRTNIQYGKRDATESELEKVAESAQLLSFIRSLPDGWDTVVGDRGLKLSGGEKQRTAIARCLLKNPEIVVLDEATSALDTVTESNIQQALDILGQERTCLVIAHRLGTIRNADNIVVLGDGRVLEEGTHDELLELNGKYAEMWNMQLHSTHSSNPSLSEMS